ncbi:MAG TPA: response regulator transcription factor [Chthoniobacterales bacterium]|nr:response regulator transcription factor [Chthoniobacterales bacterium]
MRSLRVLIADDHQALLEGVRSIIEKQPGWEVCGTATTGREAVEMARKLKPDIVVLDLRMPELNGLDATRQIKRFLEGTEVLIFTAHDDEQLIHEAFAAGARSFIFKSEPLTRLVDAIESLSRHKPFFSEKVSEVLFSNIGGPVREHARSEHSTSQLTPREREIVQMLAEGKSNKEVATILGISVRTAEAHRASLMHKLGIDSIAGLVRYAIRNGIIGA